MTNPVALTYNGYVTQIALLAILNTQTVSGVVQGADAYFTSLIPQMINYAELRIQRDLDLMQSAYGNASYSLTTGSNVITVSVGDFITVQTISVVSGTQEIPLLPVSKVYVNNVWGDSSVLAIPQVFAPYGGDATTTGSTSQLFVVGPYPDQGYPLRIYGTNRVISLNSMATPTLAGTGTTFISSLLPDLLIMASMVYLSGFQRNFGRQSDDPTMAVSYEQQYGALLKGATVEEARRKLQASGWTSMSPPAVATSQR